MLGHRGGLPQGVADELAQSLAFDTPHDAQPVLCLRLTVVVVPPLAAWILLVLLVMAAGVLPCVGHAHDSSRQVGGPCSRGIAGGQRLD